jgi:peptidoglycan/xylan/chitin deacetylase (PgdA/CDA1 family)
VRRPTIAALAVATAFAVAGGALIGFATLPSHGGTGLASLSLTTPWPTTTPSLTTPSAHPASPHALGTGAPPQPTPAAIAGTSPAARPSPSLRPPRPGEIPILYYHRVQEPPPDFASWSEDARRAFLKTNVLPIALDAQLTWLAAHGYTTILPRDLAAHWDQGRKLPLRPVILTFDDGTPDWIDTVLPLLRKHGMVAEFYVTLGHVGRELTWEDLRTLMKGGNGIGAHDINHTQLAGLGNGKVYSAQRMWAEVKGARDIIGANLGVKPDSMAYVGGGYDATLIDLVRKAGYTTARSIDRGVIQTPEVRYRLRVVRIGAYDDVRSILHRTLVPGLPTFEKRVTGVDPG